MVAYVACMRRREFIQDFGEETCKKKSLGTHRCRQEYNVKTYLKE
jgi:hypothetical protein